MKNAILHLEALGRGIKNRRAKQMIVLFDSLVKLAFSLMAVYYGCRLAGRLLAGGETYGLSYGSACRFAE